MGAVSQVEVAVRGDGGRPLGTVRISLLPTDEGGSPAPLLDLRESETSPIANSTARVQLLESHEYCYRFLDLEPPLTLDKAELFGPDDESAASGRLRTGLETGSVEVQVTTGTGGQGTFRIEVRSRKLGYLDEYRWMLEDLTEVCTDAVLQHFAAAEHSFKPDPDLPAATLYQQFAFLRGALRNEVLAEAVARVLAQPHVEWRSIIEQRHVSRGAPGSSSLARQVSRPGPRIPRPGTVTWGPRALPIQVELKRVTPTVDNAANRFVRHALETWRSIAQLMRDQMATGSTSAAKSRGEAEADVLITQLDQSLRSPTMRHVGCLNRFPASNQVLQRRSGYRAILRAFVSTQLAASLSWSGGDDVYAAGKKNVAKLYEYWAYLQLAKALSEVLDRPLDFADLVEAKPSGFELRLQSGAQASLEGEGARLGRRLEVRLWFNRSFRPGKQDGRSWTRTMVPDCSIEIAAKSDYDGTSLAPVWLHFDAKYRVQKLKRLFGESLTEGEGKGANDSGGEGDPHGASPSLPADTYESEDGKAKPEDLAKMHAYRDAIRRSVGAYVLYPGQKSMRSTKYEELLPGLGAFQLRPAAGGAPAAGTNELSTFLSNVLDHVADTATRHERARYWEQRSYGDPGPPQDSPGGDPPRATPPGLLPRPPDDTLVLIGYAKSEAHVEWIADRRLYNLRADLEREGSVGLGARALAADLVLVYGPTTNAGVRIHPTTGTVRPMTAEQLNATGYPTPSGHQYYCLELEPAFNPRSCPSWLTAELTAARLKELAPSPLGAPVVSTWAGLAATDSGQAKQRSVEPPAAGPGPSPT